MSDSAPSLPAAIREALDEYREAVKTWQLIDIDFQCEEVGADILDQAEAERDAARTALEAHLLALCDDARAFDEEASAHADALQELADAQQALVLLANQLERHSVPFVPEAEAATAKARRDIDRDHRLLASGMAVAAAVFGTPPEDTTPHA